jgi:hypothetical protein
MQAKNSKNAQEEECVMKLNEMKNSKSVQKVENQQVTKVEDKHDEVKSLDIKDLIFELEAPSDKPVSNEMDLEFVKSMVALGATPSEAIRLEKIERIEKKRLFQTQMFPNFDDLTQTDQYKLCRQIVILDACRVTKEVKGRRIHYLHCRVVSRDKGLMYTSASLALFKYDALYKLIDKQLSDEEQDITGKDFKEIEYDFEGLEKPVIIVGQILKKIDINPYYEDEEHIPKLATVVRIGVDEQKLPNNEVLPARGETRWEAIERYRAFIEAAGIVE